MTGRVRLLAFVAVIAVAAVGVTTVVMRRSPGDAAADLAHARSLLDRTAERAHIRRAPGFHVDGIGACMDSFTVSRASLEYPLDLGGQSPSDVMSTVSGFWMESASGILGERVSVSIDRDAGGKATRVVASGGDWWVTMQEQLAHEGTYEFNASGPCTANTPGSIGPVAP